MIRNMTWNIFHKTEGFVLVNEDDKAIDFVSEEEAQEFLEKNPEFQEIGEIKQGILYYDGGYINSTEAFSNGF